MQELLLAVARGLVEDKMCIRDRDGPQAVRDRLGVQHHAAPAAIRIIVGLLRCV